MVRGFVREREEWVERARKETEIYIRKAHYENHGNVIRIKI